MRTGESTRPVARYRLFAEAVRQAEAQARLGAEVAALKGKPVDWLKAGPGKETAAKPGYGPRSPSRAAMTICSIPTCKNCSAPYCEQQERYPDAPHGSGRCVERGSAGGRVSSQLRRRPNKNGEGRHDDHRQQRRTRPERGDANQSLAPCRVPPVKTSLARLCPTTPPSKSGGTIEHQAKMYKRNKTPKAVATCSKIHGVAFHNRPHGVMPFAPGPGGLLILLDPLTQLFLFTVMRPFVATSHGPTGNNSALRPNRKMLTPMP